MPWFITLRLPLGTRMSSQTYKAVYFPTPPKCPICSVYPYGFNFSAHWATLAIGEGKIFSNASVPQCKVYVPWGKQHSTLLLECSTVKESVWDLALRFKDMQNSSGWADQNTQTLRPYCAETVCSEDPVHVTRGAPRTDTPQDKLPPEQEAVSAFDVFRVLSLHPQIQPETQEDEGVSGQSPWTVMTAHRHQRAARPLNRG